MYSDSDNEFNINDDNISSQKELPDYIEKDLRTIDIIEKDKETVRDKEDEKERVNLYSGK